MSIEEAINQSLKEWGYDSLEKAIKHGVLYENVIRSAMYFYGKSKWDEACDDQKTICAHSANAIVFMNTGVVHKGSILQASKPEFKP